MRSLGWSPCNGISVLTNRGRDQSVLSLSREDIAKVYPLKTRKGLSLDPKSAGILILDLN